MTEIVSKSGISSRVVRRFELCKQDSSTLGIFDYRDRDLYSFFKIMCKFDSILFLLNSIMWSHVTNGIRAGRFLIGEDRGLGKKIYVA